MDKVRDLQSFLVKAKLVYGNLYIYSKSEYVANKKPITIICKFHGEFISTPNRHLAGRGGCPKCHPNSKLHQSDFIARCEQIFDRKYDYSLVEYSNLRSKIAIVCPVHGKFFQKALSHLQGHGCTKCVDRQISFDDFLVRANVKHNYLYEYIPFQKHDKQKVNIICPIHGLFEQNIFNHLNGNGCQKCFIDSEKLTTTQFIEKSQQVHGNKYDYSESKYVNNETKLIIICPEHGSFLQRPYNHWQGVNCPKCAKGISQSEIRWLDALNIPKEFRSQSIKIGGKLFKPDAIDMLNKIIYEFYGDFWHGNPDIYSKDQINPATKTTFGELYIKTIERENFIKQHDYKIISIWESDFNNENGK